LHLHLFLKPDLAAAIVLQQVLQHGDNSPKAIATQPSRSMVLLAADCCRHGVFSPENQMILLVQICELLDIVKARSLPRPQNYD
jgi:hypothetical protein